MKKAVWFVGLAAACCLLTGCHRFSPDVSGISINDKKVITEVLKESFEESGYSQSELNNQIQSEIDAYNLAAGSKCVKSGKLKVKDGVAELVLTYAAPKDFAAFNHVDFYVGDMVGAIQAGYTFQGKFDSVSKGAVKEEGIWGSSIMSSGSNLNTIVFKQPMLVSVPGTIKYVSEGVKVTGSSEAVSETSEIAYIMYE